MQINITDVLSCKDKKMEWAVPLEMEAFVFSLGTFPIVEKSPCRLTITNLGSKRLKLTGEAEVSLEIPCDRCLTDVETKLAISFEREMEVRPSREGGTELSDYQADAGENQELPAEETEFIFGCNLDVDELVYSEILLNWPMKTLCSEACKGICKRCGANLNHGPCGCDTVELDPRMAAIREIFHTVNEEV
ncbi:MAG: DUF177 domain-containing protein [Lachnospiraceae bacterium]|nr:DUF177 domain-containing protein [Lachnospiraceae bacterium]